MFPVTSGLSVPSVPPSVNTGTSKTSACVRIHFFFSLKRSKLLWALFIVASQYSRELSRGSVAPSLFLKPSEKQINLFPKVTK